MSFAATDFEFKNRFWIIGAIIFTAFGCYNIDHTNVAFALTRKILGSSVNSDSPVFERYQLAIIAIGSLFVYLAALLRSWAESYHQQLERSRRGHPLRPARRRRPLPPRP
jgi:hypothetical protein